MRLYLLIFNLFFTLFTFAETKIIYFGGGKNNDSTNKKFDGPFFNILKYGKISNTKIESYSTDDIITVYKTLPQVKINAFTNTNFNEKIKALTQDILQKKIPAEDQLLIYINTHGGLTSDGRLALQGSNELVDPAPLKDLMSAAKKMNVKLGLVGQACYSGYFMNFNDSHTCIIAASQKDKFAYNQDNIVFSDRLVTDAGKTNLEELYLQSRKEVSGSASPTQPMISTEAGLYVDQVLSSLKNHISYDDNLADNLKSQRTCSNYTSATRNVLEKIKKIKSVGDQIILEFLSVENKKLIQNLENMLNNYQKIYNQYLAANQKQKSELEKKLGELAQSISTLERNIYFILYKEISKKKAGSNPCRDFKL
jgi:hypothetical protein